MVSLNPDSELHAKLRTVHQVFELPDSHPFLKEIPWQTATRGAFPLKGSYFQANEVFADHESTEQPIDVPKAWISHLPKRIMYCGMTATAIFQGATTDEIQDCFLRGYICFRGFHKKHREARRLNARFHSSPCAAGDIGGATL